MYFCCLFTLFYFIVFLLRKISESESESETGHQSYHNSQSQKLLIKYNIRIHEKVYFTFLILEEAYLQVVVENISTIKSLKGNSKIPKHRKKLLKIMCCVNFPCCITNFSNFIIT